MKNSKFDKLYNLIMEDMEPANNIAPIEQIESSIPEPVSVEKDVDANGSPVEIYIYPNIEYKGHIITMKQFVWLKNMSSHSEFKFDINGFSTPDHFLNDVLPDRKMRLKFYFNSSSGYFNKLRFAKSAIDLLNTKRNYDSARISYSNMKMAIKEFEAENAELLKYKNFIISLAVEVYGDYQTSIIWKIKNLLNNDTYSSNRKAYYQNRAVGRELEAKRKKYFNTPEEAVENARAFIDALTAGDEELIKDVETAETIEITPRIREIYFTNYGTMNGWGEETSKQYKIAAILHDRDEKEHPELHSGMERVNLGRCWNKEVCSCGLAYDVDSSD